MDDDALARAWDNFATALQEVPARRPELSRARYSLSDFGMLAAWSDAAEMNKALMMQHALQMRASDPNTHYKNAGLLGFRLF